MKIEDPYDEEESSADLEPGPALRVGALNLPAAAPSLVLSHVRPQLQHLPVELSFRETPDTVKLRERLLTTLPGSRRGNTCS